MFSFAVFGTISNLGFLTIPNVKSNFSIVLVDHKANFFCTLIRVTKSVKDVN